MPVIFHTLRSRVSVNTRLMELLRRCNVAVTVAVLAPTLVAGAATSNEWYTVCMPSIAGTGRPALTVLARFWPRKRMLLVPDGSYCNDERNS